MAIDDLYTFPIKTFFKQKINENNPELNSNAKGYDSIVLTPVSIAFQQVMDNINVLKRDMSIKNYPIMQEDDMDLLSANFFVSRNDGSKPYGIARIYLIERVPVEISASVRLTSGSYTYAPISIYTIPYESVNFDSIVAKHYVDVSFQALAAGTANSLNSGDAVEISGIPKSTSAEVISTFTAGSDPDTNVDLYNRVRASISNNELVTATAIKKILKENFPSIDYLSVQGYGDDGMDRDIVKVVLPTQKVIRLSHCKKTNLPLDADGDVQWTDGSGNVISNPIGGHVGAIYDITGIDFNDIQVTWDGRNFRSVSAQEGFVVRLVDDNGVDTGDYVVTRIETEQPSPLESAQKMLRLDRVLQDTSNTSYAYQLIGSVVSNSFHTGGKIDVLVDGTTNEELQVFTLGSAADPNDDVIEIPLVDYVPTNPDPGNDNPWFENNTPFAEPVLNVLEVAQVAYDDATLVEKVLVPFTDFTIVRAAYRQKFTSQENDVLRITAVDSSGGNPYFNKRLRITYLTNKTLPLMQQFVDAEENKTLDILIKPATYVILNVKVSYTGDLPLADAKRLIHDYILQTGFGDAITASEINEILFMSNATYVKHPIYLEGLRQKPNGEVESLLSSDRIEVKSYETFYPAVELSITNES